MIGYLTGSTATTNLFRTCLYLARMSCREMWAGRSWYKNSRGSWIKLMSIFRRRKSTPNNRVSRPLRVTCWPCTVWLYSTQKYFRWCERTTPHLFIDLIFIDIKKYECFLYQIYQKNQTLHIPIVIASLIPTHPLIDSRAKADPNLPGQIFCQPR